MGVVKEQPYKSKPGGPVWELAPLYPYQGEWSVQSYLNLRTSRLIEFDNGTLEFPAMPTYEHQMISAYLWKLLEAYLSARGGVAVYAPMRVRVADNKFREPDIVALRDRADKRKGNEFFDGADLVMEVVSEDQESRDRDYIDKRADYAQAGIPEYWIVDPAARKITVLKLVKRAYVEQTVATKGKKAASATLEGFEADVNTVFAQA